MISAEEAWIDTVPAADSLRESVEGAGGTGVERHGVEVAIDADGNACRREEWTLGMRGGKQHIAFAGPAELELVFTALELQVGAGLGLVVIAERTDSDHAVVGLVLRGCAISGVGVRLGW